MESKLKSRKFWVVVVAAVLTVWTEVTGTEVDPEQLFALAGIIMTWLGFQGWADKSQAASGIAMERQLYAAQMNAAMEALAAARGEEEGVVFPGPTPV